MRKEIPLQTTAGLRELYREAQDGLELTIVSTIPTLIATLEIVNPEVILVDLSLAHPDPLEAVRRVHRSAPDDHESIREMARQALINLGYRVLSACDGEEALRLCEKERPALAILDLSMPKLGGPAVASRLTILFPGLSILFTRPSRKAPAFRPGI